MLSSVTHSSRGGRCAPTDTNGISSARFTNELESYKVAH
jgi:hypothetical protein